MDSRLDTYDWGEVFGCAGEPGHFNTVVPQPVIDSKCELNTFTREDVAHILDMSEGENDGPSWLIVVLLNDQRFAFIEAGCDYTGWDCQSGGSSWVSDSLKMLYHYGMTDEARERLPGVKTAIDNGQFGD